MSKILPYTLMLAGAAYISLFGVPGLSGKASQESKPSTPVAGEASQSLQDLSLEQILGPQNAYAGDFPNPFEGDLRFDFFDRGVYEYGAEGFPESRYSFHDMLSPKEGDLNHIFIQNTDLYDSLGQYLEGFNENRQIGTIGFNLNASELGIAIQIDETWYIGFKSADKNLIQNLYEVNNK